MAMTFQAFPEVCDFPRAVFFRHLRLVTILGVGCFFSNMFAEPNFGRKTKQAQEEIPALVF
jgi:hypothetical protein